MTYRKNLIFQYPREAMLTMGSYMIGTFIYSPQ